MATLLKTTQVDGLGSATSGMLHYTQLAEISYDPPSLAPNGTATFAVTVPGCVLGQAVLAAFSGNLAGCLLHADVSAAGTVTVAIHNPTAGTVNISNGLLRLAVLAVFAPAV